jgi:pilus assembly protein CpaB
MGRRTLLLLAALLLAALGTALVWVYVQGADDRARGDNASVSVYFTTKPIPLGTPVSDLKQGYLTTQAVARRLAVGALTSLAEVQNLVAAVPIPKDVLLSAGMFTSADKTPAAITIKDGMLAVSVALGDPQRVAGFPTQGSFVTIFVTGNATTGASTAPKGGTGGAGGTDNVTTTVIKRPVKVITVGSVPTQPLAKTATGTGSSVGTTIVTLELTPDEAARVIAAQAAGALYLGLLNPDTKTDQGVGQPTRQQLASSDIFR